MTEVRSGQRVLEGRTVVGDPLKRFLLVCLGFAILVIGIGSVDVARVNPMSTLDEFTHVDYAFKVSEGHIPARGSTMSPEVLEEWSCVDQASYPLTVSCGTDGPPSAFPLRGENYNFIHPPVYYAITGLFAKAVTAVFPDVLFLTAARWSGLLWCVAGMVVLYAALRTFRMDWRVAAATAALPFAWSPIFTASTIVTNDAPSLVSGALALLMLARYATRGHIGWITPALIAGLIASTKVVNALALLMVVLVIFVISVVTWIRDRDRSQIRNIVGALGAPIAVLIVFVGWSRFQAGRGVAEWISPIQGVTGLPLDGNPLGEWLTTTFLGFSQFDIGYIASPIEHTTVTFLTDLLGVIGVAAAFLALALFRRNGRGLLVAAAVIVGLLLYPLIVQIQVYITTDGTYYFPDPSGRYAMSIHVMMIAGIGLVAERLGWTRAYLWCVGVAIAATAVAVVSGI